MLKIIRNNLAISDQYGGEELLARLLEREKVEILHDEKGKPYLEDGPEFSLSDSGKMNVCVVSMNGAAVGVDMQNETKRPRIARRFFNEEEQKIPFAKVWARKEAYAKWLGEGLNRENLRVDTTKLEFEEYKIGNYYIAVFPAKKTK